MNKLCPHLITAHGRPADVEYVRALRPSIIKFVDAAPSRVAEYAAASPQSKLFLRNWAQSEQKEDAVLRPEETGRRHADEWARDLDGPYKQFDRSRVIASGINEPQLWADARWSASEYIKRFVAYEVSFADRLHEHRIAGALCRFSVGWPANMGQGVPPDWAPFAPIRDAIVRGKHYLCVHEYWDERGPGFNAGWWANRVAKCPWNVPIIIGECGIDKYVADPSVGMDRRGWLAWVPPEKYAEQVKQYLAMLDARVVGACVFTTDYGSRDWFSFDTAPAHGALQQVYMEEGKGSLATVPDIQPPPATPTPNVVHPLPRSLLTQHWGENGDIYAAFGLWGHNGVDYAAAQGTPVRCVADGVVEWVDVDADYGNYVRVRHPKLGCDTFYAHLSKQSVNRGQAVLATQTLGEVGSTGNSTGPHLHFEVRLLENGAYKKGTPMPKGRICPETWLSMNGVSN